MAVVENKPKSSAFPVIWMISVAGLILYVFFLGAANRSQTGAPLNPLPGLVLSIDRTRPQGDFGSAGLGQLFTLVEQIIASDGAGSDNFGSSVSISGNTAVIGAPYRDDLGSHSGAVYVFYWDELGHTWAEVKKLLASDGGENQYFGTNARVYGDTIFSGYKTYTSLEKVYVFERNFGGQDNWGRSK